MLDKEQISRRYRSPELWLLQLQAFTRLGPLAFGTLFAVLLFGLLMLPLLLAPDAGAFLRANLDGALFFSASLGVIAGCTGPVFRGAGNDVAALQGVLPLGAVEIAQLQAVVTREPRLEMLLTLCLGLLCGLGHAWLMEVPQLPLPLAITSGAGTLLLWGAMWLTVPPLISNAQLFRSLGRMATPDLLRPSRHAAFGRAALRPALFIIALLCIYPLLAFGDGLRGAALIGFAVTCVTLVGLFFLPLRGIRRRIREVRMQTLEQLDERADALYQGDITHADAARLFELDAVLDIRERVARAPGWPLDLQGVQRILLYVVLPPLTWAAAALLEMYLDTVL